MKTTGVASEAIAMLMLGVTSTTGAWCGAHADSGSALSSASSSAIDDGAPSATDDAHDISATATTEAAENFMMGLEMGKRRRDRDGGGRGGEVK